MSKDYNVLHCTQGHTHAHFLILKKWKPFPEQMIKDKPSVSSAAEKVITSQDVVETERVRWPAHLSEIVPNTFVTILRHRRYQIDTFNIN